MKHLPVIKATEPPKFVVVLTFQSCYTTCKDIKEWTYSGFTCVIKPFSQTMCSQLLYKQFQQCDSFDVHCVIQGWRKYTLFKLTLTSLHDRAGCVSRSIATPKQNYKDENTWLRFFPLVIPTLNHIKQSSFISLSTLLLHAPACNAVT